MIVVIQNPNYPLKTFPNNEIIHSVYQLLIFAFLLYVLCGVNSIKNMYIGRNDSNTPAAMHSNAIHNSSAWIPLLPLSIIDETSSVGFICHSSSAGSGCSRPRAGAVGEDAERGQLMPCKEKILLMTGCRLALRDTFVIGLIYIQWGCHQGGK